MTDYLELTYVQVGSATLLILVNAAISLMLNLGLTRSLLIASLRTIVQLWLIGLVLQWIFQADRAGVVLGLMVFMTLVAGLTAGAGLVRAYRGIFITTTVSMWASSWLVGLYALTFVFHERESWYQPQYTIPMLGMLLGNTLNGITIGLDSLLEAFENKRLDIESRLCLGATRWEAARPELQEAVRVGMIPVINSMMIVGLVSLPGMMTGQLLSGTAPIEAVKYQIVIMFLIAAATALGTVAAVMLGFFRLFTRAHQLDPERLLRKK